MTDTQPHILTKTEILAIPRGENHLHLQPEEPDAHFVLNLVHPNSSVTVTAGIIAESISSSITLTINHQAPGTTADVLVKTLGSGSATCSFHGLLVINPHTPNCKSYLTHKSLLFDQATSTSWPALEIANNEVACSHAASSQTITDTDLFYLQSRGLSAQEGRTLLIQAFLSDVTFSHAQ